MKFIERQLPILLWQSKAKRARLIPKHMKAVSTARRQAIDEARRLQGEEEPNTSATSDIAAFQFQLGSKHIFRFEELSDSGARPELAQNEVCFVPLSLAVNRYITYYNSAYFHLDIGNFVDPNSQLNSPRFKTVPCWGRCVVQTSAHPDFKEGEVYYGFWPLAAYTVRKIENAQHQENDLKLAYLSLPQFTGPKEWLKIVNLDNFDSPIADNYEYIKIGYTFARALQDLDCYGAKRLALSSASSMSAQIIAMCCKHFCPALNIVGFTSKRNFDLVSSRTYFDEVCLYDDVTSSANDGKSLYFDALGKEELSLAIFSHFSLSRWWVYGEGSEKSFTKLLKKNRRGTFYSNLVDSHCYQIDHGITDADILRFFKTLAAEHQLEHQWSNGIRQMSSNDELAALYQSFLDNTQKSGEKAVYQSPLLK